MKNKKPRTKSRENDATEKVETVRVRMIEQPREEPKVVRVRYFETPVKVETVRVRYFEGNVQ